MLVTIPVKLQLPLIMTKNLHKYILAIICLLGMVLLISPKYGYAQFIDLQLDIESKVTAQTEQALDFGTLATNSGRRMIEFGGIDMGVFSISALENQILLITLDKPDELRHNNPAIENTIPLQLFSRYGYSSQNYRDSRPLPETISSIKVESNPEPGPWNNLYIFMYGSVDIGDVPDGIYTNQIILNLEYI